MSRKSLDARFGNHDPNSVLGKALTEGDAETIAKIEAGLKRQNAEAKLFEAWAKNDFEPGEPTQDGKAPAPEYPELGE